MKHGKYTLALALFLSLGCQSQNQDEALNDLLQSSSAECPAVNTSETQLIGNSSGEVGNALTYSVISGGNCLNGNSVNWVTVGSHRSTTSRVGLVSQYKKAGTYVVAAQQKSSQEKQLSIRTTVVSQAAAINAPQAAFSFSEIPFEVILPSGVNSASVEMNFGDGNSQTLSGLTTQHMFFAEGNYTVTARITTASGEVHEASHKIDIITSTDGLECIQSVALAGPNEALLNVSTAMQVFIPDCMMSHVGAVAWDFGDNGTGSGQSVTHIYRAVGTYQVSATLFRQGETTPWIRLYHSVRVIEDTSGEEEEEEEPEVPGPLRCSVDGDQRTIYGDITSEQMACGTGGTKTVSSRDEILQRCEVQGAVLQWKEVSRKKEVTHESECSGQFCTLPNGETLAHGQSRVFYSSSTPAGNCSAVSENRICQNGTLSGSSSHSQTQCSNGCGEFGSHGTTRTGVISGEISVAAQCQFNETGFFDIFHKLEDQMCVDGQVVSSNERSGAIKTPAVCPTYSYVGTDRYTTCSENCGGEQNRIFVCQDNKGQVVDDNRCAGIAKPVETRLCDANPDAVRRQEVSTSTEEANSSATCPKNEIGVISKQRDVTKTTVYACIDHKVQVESETSVPGEWVVESYCRPYVARRCSQDSLSNSEAQGRYLWMQKCRSQLPVIDQFLTQFADVSIKVGGKDVKIGSSGRDLYPTFMNTATKPEKPWIAPKKESAKCEMPATAYVATVCVSSCATPEQQILAYEKSQKAKYSNFFDAYAANISHVASMSHAGSLTQTSKTKVEQWVTELVDGEHDILVFSMKSGRQIKVTPNHTLLAQNMMMKEAKEFVVGESLVQVGGKADAIVKIEPIKHQGKVYNVFVQSSAPHANILILNGYLNGSAYFQNDGAKELNRSLFRRNMTKGAF